MPQIKHQRLVGQLGLKFSDLRVLEEFFNSKAALQDSYTFEAGRIAEPEKTADILFVNWDDMDALSRWNHVRARNTEVVAIAISEEDQDIRKTTSLVSPFDESALMRALDEIARESGDLVVPDKGLPSLDVLVVDDSASARQYLGILLEELSENLVDLDVTYACDGNDGIKCLENKAFDLAFLDIVMPDLDGYELCRFAKKIKPDTRVALLTGKLTDMDRAKGMEAGCNHYVAKPPKEEWLATILNISLKANQSKLKSLP